MAVPLPQLIRYVEQIAPMYWAQEWDKVGLQIGDREGQISSLSVTLDVSPGAVSHAAQIGAQLIIAHHPLIFTPIDNLTRQEPSSLLLKQIIQNNLNIYITHTNFDACVLGGSNLVADLLGLKNRKVLSPVKEKTYKLVVFVPADQAEILRKAIGDTGAGVIGDYSYCAFQTSGRGFFQAAVSSHPFVGQAGEMNSLAEVRLETIVPQAVIPSVLQAIKDNHPYQEPAYDLYPLHNPGTKTGLGVIGDLPQPHILPDLAKILTDKLKLNGLRWVGQSQQEIKQVAICSGSGGDLIKQAKNSGAQLFISGDFKYHQARQAQMLDLALMDIGHFACENQAMATLAENLKGWSDKEGLGVKVEFYQGDNDPFIYF
ncbi:MAG: Nif3-like dinuclear metal center hexameric protein [Candidatus Schekmanbacteria bacterium]|nr:Nif3-like dinuclear metal center hexameric protein [Candidatus Schekmanbacteria bacterium]